MSRPSPFVLPEGLSLALGGNSLVIRHSGDVVLEQSLGRRLSRLDAGGDLTLHFSPITGSLSAGGVVRAEGDVDADEIRGDEVHVGAYEIRARAIVARTRVVIGAANVDIDVIVAPEVVIDPHATGRIRIVDCLNERPPLRVRGCLSLEEFEQDFGGAAEFLAHRGVLPVNPLPAPGGEEAESEPVEGRAADRPRASRGLLRPTPAERPPLRTTRPTESEPGERGSPRLHESPQGAAALAAEPVAAKPASGDARHAPPGPTPSPTAFSNPAPKAASVAEPAPPPGPPTSTHPQAGAAAGPNGVSRPFPPPTPAGQARAEAPAPDLQPVASPPPVAALPPPGPLLAAEPLPGTPDATPTAAHDSSPPPGEPPRPYLIIDPPRGERLPAREIGRQEPRIRRLVQRVQSGYSQPPEPVKHLTGLLQSGQTETLAAELDAVWLALLRDHIQRRAAVPRVVVQSFHALHALLYG